MTVPPIELISPLVEIANVVLVIELIKSSTLLTDANLVARHLVQNIAEWVILTKRILVAQLLVVEGNILVIVVELIMVAAGLLTADSSLSGGCWWRRSCF